MGLTGESLKKDLDSTVQTCIVVARSCWERVDRLSKSSKESGKEERKFAELLKGIKEQKLWDKLREQYFDSTMNISDPNVVQQMASDHVSKASKLTKVENDIKSSLAQAQKKSYEITDTLKRAEKKLGGTLGKIGARFLPLLDIITMVLKLLNGVVNLIGIYIP